MTPFGAVGEAEPCWVRLVAQPSCSYPAEDVQGGQGGSAHHPGLACGVLWRPPQRPFLLWASVVPRRSCFKSLVRA